MYQSNKLKPLGPQDTLGLLAEFHAEAANVLAHLDRLARDCGDALPPQQGPTPTSKR